MDNFNFFLEKIGEVGYVEQVFRSIILVSGLPQAHPQEIVVFESGQLGQVISLKPDYIEILSFSNQQVKLGTKVARTSELLKVPLNVNVLGKVIDPLGKLLTEFSSSDWKLNPEDTEYRQIDIDPPAALERKVVEKPFETGVSIIDLILPLGKGQRELVIGDRKTGKTQFLLQSMFTQANDNSVCIYCVIGQKGADINKLYEFLESSGIKDKSLIVASRSSDPSGLIFLTPYTAMTFAEFFRDNGRDVLIILDDMTSHARYYREISLLARRFPGRSSYPGDIFYVHSKLIERAGNFEKGSITCLPVAESLLGDLSGYIQTNLMSMTDGHLFFDIDIFNQGRRPSVNPFLSVTRVGRQTQNSLMQDISNEITRFLVSHQKMSQFMHFGAEVNEAVKSTLARGEKLLAFFNQADDVIMPSNLSALLVAILWAGFWDTVPLEKMKEQVARLLELYKKDQNYHNKVNEIISSCKNFQELQTLIKNNSQGIII